MLKMSDQLCKLFVGGLNVDTDSNGLRKHFEQYGTLTDCIVIVNKHLQRSRCFGFVTYSTPEEADTAMKARPHTIDGNAVELKRAVVREDANKPEALAKVKKIFVGGLKDDIEEEHLIRHFSQYGDVEKAEVISEKETGKKRGFGFVFFVEHDAANKAVIVKFHNISGHKVEVKKALTNKMQVLWGWSTFILRFIPQYFPLFLRFSSFLFQFITFSLSLFTYFSQFVLYFLFSKPIRRCEVSILI
uniref:RRM domain-containing protein n=1 Tax=Cynoglossus semilaevis TaxID=244447 RepID=A0A3P8W3C8_CYNSE